MYHVALLAGTLLIMSSVGDMTVDSDSPPSCSHLSSSDEEVIASQNCDHEIYCKRLRLILFVCSILSTNAQLLVND